MSLTVDVIPHPNPILVNISSPAQTEHHPTLTGSEDPSRSEEAVPRYQDRIQHGFVQEGVTHPLGNNHIHFGHPIRKRDVFDFSPNHPGRNSSPLSVAIHSPTERGDCAVCCEKGRWDGLRDDVVMTVIFDYLFRSFHDIARVDGVDPFRSRTSREHGKYSGSTADVENDCVVEHGGCPQDEGRVCRGAYFVSEHRRVDI